jgi:hypothetical protein
MTTNAQLLSRVRTNINEPATVATPYRSDAEIYQWLQDSQMDYLHRVPQEHFPELQTSVTFSGTRCSLPTDYLFFYSLTVSHTLSGTYTGVDDCFLLAPGESYMVLNYPTALGAWAQIAGAFINAGPNVYSGTLTYVKTPVSLGSTSSVTLSLSEEHESALVAYATAQALSKTNDADSDLWISNYSALVEAKGGQATRKEAKEVERA